MKRILKKFLICSLVIANTIAFSDITYGKTINDYKYIQQQEKQNFFNNDIKENGYYLNNYIVNHFSITKSRFKSFNNMEMNYFLYNPNTTPYINEKIPLIIYLHGLDGCGNNIEQVCRIEGLPNYIEQGYIHPNAIVLAPQCPTRSWSQISNNVMELIEQTINEYDIDTNRISITGMSLGGIGTFDMMIKYPNFFSCGVPLCANVNVDRCTNLTNIPIKIFHGTEDYAMGFSVVNANDTINRNGGCSTLFMLQGEGHEIRHVYLDEEYDIVNWMINQNKEKYEYVKLINEDCK